MESIDAKVFTLITVATLFVVGVLKYFFPKKMKGKEAGVAMLLPVLFTIGAKAAGEFTATPWVDALLWAMGGAVASGVAHDKIVNPTKSALKSFLPKRPPSQ